MTADEPVVANDSREVHPSTTADADAGPKIPTSTPPPSDELNRTSLLSGPIRLPLNGFTYS